MENKCGRFPCFCLVADASRWRITLITLVTALLFILVIGILTMQSINQRCTVAKLLCKNELFHKSFSVLILSFVPHTVSLSLSSFLSHSLCNFLSSSSSSPSPFLFLSLSLPLFLISSLSLTLSFSISFSPPSLSLSCPSLYLISSRSTSSHLKVLWFYHFLISLSFSLFQIS